MALSAVYLLGFVASHPLAKKVGGVVVGAERDRGVGWGVLMAGRRVAGAWDAARTVDRPGRWGSGGDQQGQDRGIGVLQGIHVVVADQSADRSVGFGVDPGRSVIKTEVRQPG